MDQAGHKRIVDAIDIIDQKSDGEIYCLIAADASHYREIPLLWAALAALVLPPLALAFNIGALLNGGWDVGTAPLFDLSAYVLTQAILFGLVVLLVSMRKIRLALTPRFLKTHRVRKLAAQHFVSTGIHLKQTQPHVLIFVALAERQVEIIADKVIHDVTGAGVWEAARDVIVAGMNGPDPAGALVKAVEIVGEPLITHFPATAEFPDINANGVGEIS